ncbi:unnamed protein product [Diamesa tonsa]
MPTFYSCSVTALENPNDNKIITRYNGVHMENKNDKNVEQLYISHTNTEYIPFGLGSLFYLTALGIQYSQLVEIRSKDFQGMQNLEFLSLRDNKLISLPSDAFSSLLKLKHFDLSSNLIKFIGSRSLDKLSKLNYVGFDDNICVNKHSEGTSEITQMINDIKLTCDKANDIIQYEIEHKITKEIRDESKKASDKNQMDLKVLNQNMDKFQDKNQEQYKELNEMIKTLLKASEGHQIEQQENIKLRAELSLAKTEQKKEQESNTKVLNERDQLIKELSDELTEAKETIDQKLPKMEQTINEFHMEVMDQKIERHHQRELYREIRSKLMEAKEQLAECQINERISC